MIADNGDGRRVSTPDHLAPQTVKCSGCGVVYFVGAMHMCGNTIRNTPTYEEGRLAGLREAAEIARWHERTLRTNMDAFDANGADAVMCAAEAIEAAVKVKP